MWVYVSRLTHLIVFLTHANSLYYPSSCLPPPPSPSAPPTVASLSFDRQPYAPLPSTGYSSIPDNTGPQPLTASGVLAKPQGAQYANLPQTADPGQQYGNKTDPGQRYGNKTDPEPRYSNLPVANMTNGYIVLSVVSHTYRSIMCLHPNCSLPCLHVCTYTLQYAQWTTGVSVKLINAKLGVVYIHV